MDLTLSPDEEATRTRFDDLLEQSCSIERVRRAEPVGFDRDLWRVLAGAGLLDLAIRSPDDDLLRLSLVAEAAGRRLAPAPVPEAVAAARLMARLAPATARSWEASARTAGDVATLALRPCGAKVAPLVPAGAVAHAVLVFSGDAIRLVEGAPPGAAPANLGSSPLADRAIGDGREVVAGSEARALWQRSLDDWRVLTANTLVGLASGALDLAVAYVCTREQFDVPVGSYQTVQHRLADIATAVDGARLLAQEAAWAADEREPNASALAAMALVWSTQTAQEASKDALHFHGGYGFTMEYDVQLYFRRAKAWPLALEDPRHGLQHAADRLFGLPGS